MWLPLASLPSPICEDGAVRCGRVRVKSHTVLAQWNVLPGRYLLGRWVSSSLQARSNEGDAVGVLAVDDMRRACSRVPVRYNCNTLLAPENTAASNPVWEDYNTRSLLAHLTEDNNAGIVAGKGMRRVRGDDPVSGVYLPYLARSTEHSPSELKVGGVGSNQTPNSLERRRLIWLCRRHGYAPSARWSADE